MGSSAILSGGPDATHERGEDDRGFMYDRSSRTRRLPSSTHDNSMEGRIDLVPGNNDRANHGASKKDATLAASTPVLLPVAIVIVRSERRRCCSESRRGAEMQMKKAIPLVEPRAGAC
jgi:hypothetical protein